MVDARVPVRFGVLADREEGDAVLAEGGPPPSEPAAAFTPEAHAAACACCTARSGAAQALSGLFQDRARGRVLFFRRVLAVTGSAAGEAAVRDALRSDPVASAWFRLD